MTEVKTEGVEGEPLQALPPELWDHIISVSHASAVIVGAAALDDRLRRLIGGRLPNLSKTLETKLFEGTGPLGAFSARIDVAFAMGLIDSHTKGELGALRHLRNCFAHAPETLGLKSPEPARRLGRFTGYKPGVDPQAFLLEKLNGISEKLRPIESQQALVKALEEYASKHGSPFEPRGLINTPSPLHPPRDPGGSDTDGGGTPPSDRG